MQNYLKTKLRINPVIQNTSSPERILGCRNSCHDLSLHLKNEKLVSVSFD